MREHLEFQELDQEALKEPGAVLSPDAADQLAWGRVRGFQLTDVYERECRGFLVWEKGTGEQEARILALMAKSREEGAAVLREYQRRAASEGIQTSVIEVPLGREETEELLYEADYVMELSESEDLFLSCLKIRERLGERLLPDSGIKALFNLSTKQFGEGIRECVIRRNPGAAGLLSLPMYYFDPDISCVSLREDGRVQGMLLVHVIKGGETDPLLKVELVVSKRPEAGKRILEMTGFALRNAMEKFSGDPVVLLRRQNAMERRLTRRLFPWASGREAVRASRVFDPA